MCWACRSDGEDNNSIDHFGKETSRKAGDKDEAKMDHKEEGCDCCLSKILAIDNVRTVCHCSAYNIFQTLLQC
jgi:hypothetical protein